MWSCVFGSSSRNGDLCSFPGEMDEDTVQVISYKGVKKEDSGSPLNPCSRSLPSWTRTNTARSPFSYFPGELPRPGAWSAMGSSARKVIVPLRTDKGSSGSSFFPATGTGQTYGLQEGSVHQRDRALLRPLLWKKRESFPGRPRGPHDGACFFPITFSKRGSTRSWSARGVQVDLRLIMFDIDHFKKFNDAYGHLQGDGIIREIARCLCKSIRQVDFPAR